MAGSDLCAAMGCKHPRKSHELWGECTEKKAFYNEHLYGFDQPLIYKLCRCRWVEPGTFTTRAVRDDPQA